MTDSGSAMGTAPVPAVIIAVGAVCETACAQVGRIWLRGGARRAQVTRFLCLRPGDDGMPALLALEDAPDQPAASEDGFALRRSALRQTCAAAETLRETIEQELRAVRVQENLAAAGWQDTYLVPGNIFLVVDLADAWAQGALLPLLALAQDAADTLDVGRCHLLLKTALFGGAEGGSRDQPAGYDPRLAAAAALQELDALLRGDADARAALLQEMHCRRDGPPEPAVYLFDAQKEDGTQVRDEAHAGLLLGNALLALVQEDTAQRMAAQRAAAEPSAGGCFYSSIGCVALLYDPQFLQDACARRAASEFLRAHLAGDARQPPAEGAAAALEEALGGVGEWLDALAAATPPELGRLQRAPGKLGLSLRFTGLDLPALDVEAVPETPWVKDLEARQAMLQEKAYPLAREHWRSALEDHARERLAALERGLDALPLAPGMNPGGAATALRALDLFEGALEREQAAAAAAANLGAGAAALEQEALERGARLQSILNSAPRAPRLLRWLPDFARRPLVGVWVLRRMGPRAQEAYRLRAEIIDRLQRAWAARAAGELLAALAGPFEQARERARQAREDLLAYGRALEGAGEALAGDWGPFPADVPAGEGPDARANGWDAVYRAPAVDCCAAQWVFERWALEPAQWLEDYRAALRGCWRAADAGVLRGWLLARGAAQYRPAWDLSLDDVLRAREQERPGTARALVDAGLRMSTPLARPDFDAVGGPGFSLRTRHAFTGSPAWETCRLPPPAAGEARWEAAWGGDGFTALFLQARHAMPLAALAGLTRPSALRLEELPAEVRARYALLGAGAFSAAAAEGEDALYKVFQWTFRPRGRGKEAPQRVELAISRARYSYYHRQLRFAGEWNRYAECEMPEVRELANAFARLHQGQKWTTFNQAFNVLQFVQACIPYGYDRDTTGHEDWARYPIETLVDGTGDCEDVAILCAAVIARLGFRVVLLLYPRHLAFGVAGADRLKGEYVVDPASGLKYFYGEATHQGWHLGQIPKDFQGMAPEQILPVNLVVDETED